MGGSQTSNKLKPNALPHGWTLVQHHPHAGHTLDSNEGQLCAKRE